MIIPCFESKGQDNGFFSYEIPLNEALLLKVAGGTKKGIEHEEEMNQDNYCAVGPLLVVADGLGGHFRGDIGSRIVADCLSWYGQRTSELFPYNDRKAALMQYLLAEHIPAEKVKSIEEELDLLTKGIKAGWGIDAVCTGLKGSASSMLKKISPDTGRSIDSTVVAAEFNEGKIFWYHQGDSCLAYIPSNEPYQPLALPDNFLGDLVASVSMPNQERLVKSQSVKEGDTYVLFSDALLLQGRAIEFLPKISKMYQEAPAGFEVPYIAHILINEAWKAGDDTTIIVARVEGKKESTNQSIP